MMDYIVNRLSQRPRLVPTQQWLKVMIFILEERYLLLPLAAATCLFYFVIVTAGYSLFISCLYFESF